MLNVKSFLAVDFGAGSLKLAEFEVNEAGALRLKQYAIKPLGAEGANETKREAVILKAVQDLLAEKGIKAKDVNVCAPGFHVFSKFVKLPPVDPGKVTQIIQYEAQQNVPFPLEEVVWDYQILGTTSGGELEVLLVAIKADIVEGLFRVTEAAGLRLQLCDVSPAALCNAFRYNYGDLEDCTMLLDIGAKTSNLLFFEKGKVYSRSINLGANSITQDFANESKLKFEDAEKLKISEGFVSLGGAYEEPESPQQAAISKIARQFMTRLHIQVNQTMQFYRGQQGGSAPQRLFLSGGASIMPYTAQFFAEKLSIPVEYFNPLRNVQIDPSINLEELARVAHSFGEVVGLGLRNLAHCPVELNLMPESTLKWQSFSQKKPYFVATVFSLVLVVAAMGMLFNQLAGVKAKELEKRKTDLDPLARKAQNFKQAYGKLKKTQDDLNLLSEWMEDRYYWRDICAELRDALIRVEGLSKRKLGADAGVWIEQLISAEQRTETPGAYAPSPPPMTTRSGELTPEEKAFQERYGLSPRTGSRQAEGAVQPTPAPDGTTAGTAGGAVGPAMNTNQMQFISVICRAVMVSRIVPGTTVPDTEIVYAVQNELQNNSPLFDPKETKLTGNMTPPDEATGTFSFGLTIALKRPLKL
jgi:type IV pilus assembly protein PilM